jgi:hypothetical protein
MTTPTIIVSGGYTSVEIENIRIVRSTEDGCLTVRAGDTLYQDGVDEDSLTDDRVVEAEIRNRYLHVEVRTRSAEDGTSHTTTYRHTLDGAPAGKDVCEVYEGGEPDSKIHMTYSYDADNRIVDSRREVVDTTY